MAKFQYVLGAAILLMLLFGIYADYQSPGDDPGENVTDEYLVSENFGWIGESETTSRNILSKERLDITHESPNRTIESFSTITVQDGFPGDSMRETVELNAVDPEALYISFTVEEANHHGDLQFFLDGVSKESLAPETGQRHTVKIDDLERGESTLLMSAKKSPAHIFWTANRYVLNDVEVIVEDQAVQKNTETFKAHEYELSGFQEGRIDFHVRDDNVEATSPLKIDINGNRVFERSPVPRASAYEATFSKEEANLGPGENTISVYSEPGVYYRLENLNVDLHYITTTDRTTVQTYFELPFVDYQLLSEDQGIIEYYVENRGVGEELEINLPNANYTQTPTVGWNELRFSKEDVDRGENRVQLTTSGSYEITRFRVYLED